MIHSTAAFSQCRLYRYELTRRWDTGPTLHFCMLNPSTADDINNDPTVERCQRRAALLGYSALIVTNIFAWRSTDPMVLYGLEDPIGPENDRYILAAAAISDMTVCGWGQHADLHNRGETVERLLRSSGKRLHYLKMGKRNHPYHPLYVGYKVQPQEWKK